jgi:hypothetical protein
MDPPLSLPCASQYTNAFRNAFLQPAWVWADNLFDNSKYIWEAVSHEVRLGVGLEPD